MYAVIKTGGKQYRVSEGDVLRIEKLEAEPRSEIEFDEVLMIADGDTITTGTPTIAGGKVSGLVRDHGRHAKVDIIKFRRRKHYRRQGGHRQHFTEVQITGISAG